MPATLNGNKSDGKYTNWEYYVAMSFDKNRKYPIKKEGTKIAFAPAFKKVGNVLRAIGELRFGKDFVKILDSKIFTFDKKQYALTDAGYVLISHIGKPHDKNTLKKENLQLADFQSKLDKIAPIDIVVGTKTYNNIVRCEKAKSNSCKADFVLSDSSGREVVWISVKDGSSPKQFQQYGSLTASSSDVMYKNSEVAAFSEKVYLETSGDFASLSRGASFTSEIRDVSLKMAAAFGPEYGKKFGEDNVQIVIQGELKLEPVANREHTVRLSGSTHTAVNGDRSAFIGDYDAVLFARTAGDRDYSLLSGKKIRKCRLLIMTKAYVKTRANNRDLTN